MEAKQTTATSLCSITPVRETEGAPKVGIYSLPVELVETILREAQKRKKQKENEWLVAIVCRSVCKQWRSLLPSPDLEARREDSYPFVVSAVRAGSISLLQWVLDHGAELADDTCTKAAMGGQVEVLKWLRANGCPWQEYVCRIQWTL